MLRLAEARAAVQRLVSDPKTGRPSFVPLGGPTQALYSGCLQRSYGQDTRTTACGHQRRRHEGGGRRTCPGHARGARSARSRRMTSLSPAKLRPVSLSGMAMAWARCAGMAKHGSMKAGCRTPSTKPGGWSKTLKEFSGSAAADGKVLRVEVAAHRHARLQGAGHLAKRRPDRRSVPMSKFVAGSIFAAFDRSKNMFRWDAAGPQVCRRQSFSASHRCSRRLVISLSNR